MDANYNAYKVTNFPPLIYLINRSRKWILPSADCETKTPPPLSKYQQMSHKPPLVVGYRVLTRLDDIPAVAWNCRYSPKNPANSGV